MDDFAPIARLEINVPNVVHNLRYFKSKLKEETKMLVLVKANSYGHGALPFARVMEKEGVDYLAVATPSEGVALRKGGISLPIIVLTAGVENYPLLIKWNLEPGIPNLYAVEKMVKVVREMGIASYPVHIKLDTGMHRLGFMEKELDGLIDFLKCNSEIEVASIYSHFAASDIPSLDDYTLRQVALFERMSSRIMAILPHKPLRHILNSAGIERFPEYQYDMVRLGIGIYGISAVDDMALKPSAFFKCPIIQIKELSAEDGTVGYGCLGILGEGITRIATIPVGYADGIDRHLGRGNASFQINGKLAPTIGKICMDMCMLDITGIDAKIGDTVTIFGDNPHVSRLAEILDTIPYEIYTSIPERVCRIVADNPLCDS